MIQDTIKGIFWLWGRLGKENDFESLLKIC